MQRISVRSLVALLALVVVACGGEGGQDVALCDAAEHYDAAGDAVIEAVADTDDDIDALIEPTVDSIEALDAISHELDDAQAEPFRQIAEAQQGLIDALRSDPPRLPEDESVPQQVHDEARLILIDRCGIDVEPSIGTG